MSSDFANSQVGHSGRSTTNSESPRVDSTVVRLCTTDVAASWKTMAVHGDTRLEKAFASWDDAGTAGFHA